MPEHLVYLGLGAAILAVSWLPLVLRRLPLSLPMLAVAAGFLLAAALDARGFAQSHKLIAERLLEVVLVIAVMGAGLRIDRPFGWRHWGSAWRLLLVTMPLSILGIALLAHLLLGFPAALALLLGGILAPTDPVLAASVQSGPPGAGEDGEVRFSLTTEAGLNDGLAFPFVTLGLILLGQESAGERWLWEWLAFHVLWKVAASAGIGLLLGWGLVRLSGFLPEAYRLPASHDGLAAVGLTFLAYGLAEAARANGFVAVFVTAAALRNIGYAVDYHRELSTFLDQTERLVTFLVLALFGAGLAGGLLAPVGWPAILFAALTLFLVRPLASLVGLLGSRQKRPVCAAIGFLGIRGLGSLYYASYVVNDKRLGQPEELWGVVGLVVLASIVVYGAGADGVMRWVERRCRAGDG